MKSPNNLPAALSEQELRTALERRAAAAGQLMPRDEKPQHKVSKRASGVWKRWIAFYGASKLESFGDWPGPDLCALIDSIKTLDGMRTVLAVVSHEHPSWPPTTGEFAAIVNRVQPVQSVDRGALWASACDYIARKYWQQMTFTQQRGMIYTNDGVLVPRDGDSPGFFVSFEELANG